MKTSLRIMALGLLFGAFAAQAAYTPPNPNGQATMANSSPVVIASNQTGLPVTGTFWQATQPVSGTFWQVTQPVSGPLTDVQLRAVAVPVSGTFWQATQPVSLTSTTITGSVAVTGPLTDVQLRLTPVPVSLTSTTVTGTVTTNATLQTGGNVIGSLTANQSVNMAQVAGVATSTGNGVSGTGVQRVTIASDNTAFSVNATPPTLTKGTQGATGYSVQALKDAGRNPITCYTNIPVLALAADTLQSLTCTKSGATVLATTTPAVVTAGKTFRVTRVGVAYIATATSGYGMVRLRFNTAGVVAIGSPIAVSIPVGSGTPATANAAGMTEATVGDGWEFAAGTGVGASVQGIAAGVGTAVGYVHVSYTGYEY